MSAVFDWEQLRTEAIQRSLTFLLNGQIARLRDKLLGGFLYIDMLDSGSSPPTLSLTNISDITATSVKTSFYVDFHSTFKIRLRALVQYNPTVSTLGPAGVRGRLHMRTLESHIPAFSPIWAEVRVVAIQAHVEIELSNQRLNVRFNQFPLKSLKVSTCFDGSVVAQTIQEAVSDALGKVFTLKQPTGSDVRLEPYGDGGISISTSFAMDLLHPIRTLLGSDSSSTSPKSDISDDSTSSSSSDEPS